MNITAKTPFALAETLATSPEALAKNCDSLVLEAISDGFFWLSGRERIVENPSNESPRGCAAAAPLPRGSPQVRGFDVKNSVKLFSVEGRKCNARERIRAAA